MARFLAQLIVLGGQAVGRAFTQALKQEMQASAAAKKAASEAGRDGVKTVKANTFTGLSLDESKQILNISNLDDIQLVRKNYEHLFRVNDKSAGGSFYIQSKVVRARERIELELGQKLIPDDELPEEQSSQSTKPPSS